MGKSDFLGFLRKTPIMFKMSKMGHFGAQKQHSYYAENEGNRSELEFHCYLVLVFPAIKYSVLQGQIFFTIVMSLSLTLRRR